MMNEARGKKAMKFIYNIKEIMIEAHQRAKLDRSEDSYDEKISRSLEYVWDKHVRALEAEIKKVSIELREVRQEDSKVKSRLSAYVGAGDLLKERAEQLAQAKIELEANKKEEQRAKMEAEELLNNLIDLDRARELINEMERNHNSRYSKQKDLFSKAQKELNAMYDAMIDQGFRSEGLFLAVVANVNRPDRDDLSLISDEMIFDISEVEKD